MSDRNRWEYKRRPVLHDSRKEYSGSHHDRSHRSYYEHRNDRKRDRYSESRQRSHSNDSQHSNDSRYNSSREHRDERQNYKSQQYDERSHRSEKSYSGQHRPRESSSGSSYGSPYSTPPAPPPISHQHGLSNTHGLQGHYNSTFTEGKVNANPIRRTSDPRKPSVTQKDESRQNFKLLIDPCIKKGYATKIIRYNGVLNGQSAVVPKDPRKHNKIWSMEVCDLPLPEFKLDKNYVGSMPRDTIRFSGLNDNIDRKFLYELCESYGDIKEYKVYFDPKSNSHMGTGKVIFDTNTSTEKVVASLNGRSVMGKVISVWIDEKPPPGHAILKQLELECEKSRPKQQMSLYNLHTTPHTPTPRTPNISSLQRNQPIAAYSLNDSIYPTNKLLSTFHEKPHSSSVHGSVNATDCPPPPPPPGQKSQIIPCATPPPPPPLMNFENISPTGTDSSYINKIVPPILLLKQQDERARSPIGRTKGLVGRISYSPVSNSDRSNSPISPAIKDITPTNSKSTKFNKYENVSDTENSSLQVEDISPAGSPENQSKRTNDADDDDAMSMSSISSNESPKVELNVKNIQAHKNSLHATSSVSSNSSVYNFNQCIVNMFPYNNSVSTRPPTFFNSPGPVLAPQPILAPQGPIPPQQRQALPQQQNITQSSQHSPGMMNWQQTMHQRMYQPQVFQTNNPPLHVNNSQMKSNMPSVQVNQNVSSNNTVNVNDRNTGAIMPQMLHQPFNQRHTEIIRNAVYGSQNIPKIGTSFQPNTFLSASQNQPPIAFSSASQNQPPIAFSSAGQNQPTVQQQQPPVTKTLPFSFQVKAGCARDLSLELKRILSKDTLKRLVEQSAFPAFENWWGKHKITNTDIKAEKVEIDTSRKLLSDKTATINTTPLAPPPAKDSKGTTSALLQSLFGHEKNNENRPPSSANFLNSFRISRKPQAQPSMKASHMSRKRRPWPSLNRKNKLLRLEDSDDEDEDTDGNKDGDIDEDQFEQFALRHRQVRKSGSSLYQKIYSDESDDEKEEHTEDEDEQDELDQDELSSDSSVVESSTSETSSSETETDEESESEEDEIVPEGKETAEKVLARDAVSTVEQLSDEMLSQDDTESEVKFRSMYDEPRKRAAVQKAKEKMKFSLPKAKNSLPKTSRPPRKRVKKEVPIVEKSDSETDTADELEEDYVEHEHNITIDESVKHATHVEVEEEEKSENKEPTEEELINNLIMLEHNYFVPLPPREMKKVKLNTLGEKTFNEIIEDSGNLKPLFSMRNKADDNKIIWDVLQKGVDAEDLNYIKEAFESLQQVGSKDVEGITWVDHPISHSSPLKLKRTKSDSRLRVNNTGCARSEGFYRIPMLEKAQYLKSALRQLSVLQQKGTKLTTPRQAGAEHKIKSRENRAMQRRLASSIAQEEFGSLINYNQTLKMRKKALRFAKSSIHNWGLFACEPIAAEEFVCEYVGQMIRAIVAEVRERRYERSGIGSSYLFRLDMDSVIDATKNGCNARFINHSCQPNCYAKVILVEGAKKIVIYSKRDIKLAEEITYDYKFPLEDEKIPCLCDAPGCRGSLN